MENTNTKLVNTLKRLYENQEFSTTFEEEVYSWNSDETFTEDWEIRYFLKLNQILGTGSDTIVSLSTKINLIFDKPTKYLVWYVQLNKYLERNQFMVWAADNNWDKAKTNFAKLVWLITRVGLDASDPNNPIIDLDKIKIPFGCRLYVNGLYVS